MLSCQFRWTPPGTATCTPIHGRAPCTSATAWALRKMGPPMPPCTSSLAMQVVNYLSAAALTTLLLYSLMHSELSAPLAHLL